MSNNSEKVIRWRKNSKHRIVESMGGKCVCCGYNTCDNALHCHHLYGKDFGFGNARANPKSWAKLVVELRKCVLVCGNCHAEIHAGIRTVPANAARFDETFADYQHSMKRLIAAPQAAESTVDMCPVCGILKPVERKTCSLKCAGKKAWRVDWSTIDLLQELSTKSFSAVAQELGISDVAVRKRYYKLKSQSYTAQWIAESDHNIDE